MPRGIYIRSREQKEALSLTGKANTKHGLSRSRFYSIWRGMVRRCTDPSMTGYDQYGAKGVTVCELWLDFVIFKADMYQSYVAHVKKEGEKNTTLDRKDTNCGYFKNNCRWITQKKQNRNKRNNRILIYNGESKPLVDWAEQFGILKTTLRERLQRGWTVEKALETKPRNYG